MVLQDMFTRRWQQGGEQNKRSALETAGPHHQMPSAVLVWQPPISLWFILYEKLKCVVFIFPFLLSKNRVILEKNPLILKINSWRTLSLLHFSRDLKLYIQVLSGVVLSCSWIQENYLDFGILQAACRYIHITHPFRISVALQRDH